MTFLKKKKSTILSFRCLTPHEAQHQINCCVGVVLWSAIFLLRKINSAVISDNGTRLSVRCENTKAWLHLPRERTRTPFTYRMTHARAADSTYLYSYSTRMGETCWPHSFIGSHIIIGLFRRCIWQKKGLNPIKWQKLKTTYKNKHPQHDYISFWGGRVEELWQGRDKNLIQLQHIVNNKIIKWY